jgi:hypothetical protein
MGNDTLLSFNRGKISRLAAARVDLQKYALSATEMVNWMPRKLGSMMIRPGSWYLGNTLSDRKAVMVPFVFASDDKLLLELATADDQVAAMRIWDDGELVQPEYLTNTTIGDVEAGSPQSVTISNATPCVVTYPGVDYYFNGMPLIFSTSGALPTGITAGTTYYIQNVDRTAGTFNISLLPDGTKINTSSAGSGTHYIDAGAGTSWAPSITGNPTGVGIVSAMSGYNGLWVVGDGENEAIATASVTPDAADYGKTVCVRIVVAIGEVKFFIGTASVTDDSIYPATYLKRGVHVVAFEVPETIIRFVFRSNSKTPAVISSFTAHSGAWGTKWLTLTTPWLTSSVMGINTVRSLRYCQSADVMFFACENKQPFRIERHYSATPNLSWSLVTAMSSDGPWQYQDNRGISMTAAGLTGITTITASSPYFKSTNVGSFFKLSSVGQKVETSITGTSESWSDPIRVTGIDNGRIFVRTLTGTWTGTVTLQRSVSEPGDWVDVTTFTANSSANYDDTLDNQIIYYRIGCKASGLASGTVTLTLNYASGSIDGIGEVMSIYSSTVAIVSVVQAFGSTTATEEWSESLWSDRRGYPSCVTLFDGRLWYAGDDLIVSSVSDDYSSFDPDTVGDSGPIRRSIGTGAVARVNWMLPVGTLIIGTDTAEVAARASSIDEPLTPTATSLRTIISRLGSPEIAAIQLDDGGVFVDGSGIRIHEIAIAEGSFRYASNDLTSFCPEIGSPGIIKLALQRQPDTRIHCLRSDGTVAIFVYDKAEKVSCWLEYEQDGGYVDDIAVLPGTVEDEVYYVVNRGSERFLERWALESEAVGSTITCIADSVRVSTVTVPTVTIGGTSTVIATSTDGWRYLAWRADGTMTVTGSSVDVQMIVVGGGAGGGTGAGGSFGAGAGGAGGVKYDARTLPSGTHTITVGDGGPGGLYGADSGNGSPGDDSVFTPSSGTAVTAKGGGYGGGPGQNGGDGGSGGGGGANALGGSGTVGQGNDGGGGSENGSGGPGGGAGADGNDGSFLGFAGAIGTDDYSVWLDAVNIGHESGGIMFCAGGGAPGTNNATPWAGGLGCGVGGGYGSAGSNDSTAATSALPNTGSGGGSARAGGPGGNGGSGFVVLRYRTSKQHYIGTQYDGDTVAVWANAKSLGEVTVDSFGYATLSETATTAYIGFPYSATFVSTPLSLVGQASSSILTDKKKPVRVALMLADTHIDGVQVGDSATRMTGLPRVHNGAAVAADYVFSEVMIEPFAINSGWGVQSKLRIEAASPLPCTVLACVIGGDSGSKL